MTTSYRTSNSVMTWLTCAALLAGAACSGGSDAGSDGERQPIRTSELEAGDCFETGDPTPPIEWVTPVACAGPHTNEVYDHFKFKEEQWLGEDAVQAAMVNRCQSTFAEFVGTPYTSSTYLIQFFLPTEETWAEGDREGVCFLLFETVEPAIGSARDSGR